MSLKDFEYFLERKLGSGVLYQKCFSDRKICGACSYRRAWQNTCAKFNKSIQKVGQRNGGFHHLPCVDCLEYTIQQSDLDYFTNCYKNRKK